MPNSRALWMAAGLLWILDASINISMEPFRAFVADMLPDGAAHARLRHAERSSSGWARSSRRCCRGCSTHVLRRAAAMRAADGHPARGEARRSTSARSRSWAPCSGPIFTTTRVSAGGPGGVPADEGREGRLRRRRRRDLPRRARDAADHAAAWRGCRSSPGSGFFCMWLYFGVAVARNIFGARTRDRRRTTQGVAWGGQLLRHVLGRLLRLLVRAAGDRRSGWAGSSTHALCLLLRRARTALGGVHPRQVPAAPVDGRRRHRLGQHSLDAVRDPRRLRCRRARPASTWASSTSSSSSRRSSPRSASAG